MYLYTYTPNFPLLASPAPQYVLKTPSHQNIELLHSFNTKIFWSMHCVLSHSVMSEAQIYSKFKNSLAVQWLGLYCSSAGGLALIPGRGTRRQWTPLQQSCLENPMHGGAWQATVHGVAKSQTQLSDFTFTFHFHALKKEMATDSSVLAWKIPGMGEPRGLPSMGSQSWTRLK